MRLLATLSILIVLMLAMVMASGDLDGGATSADVADSPHRQKARNADLLSFKMFDEDAGRRRGAEMRQGRHQRRHPGRRRGKGRRRKERTSTTTSTTTTTTPKPTMSPSERKTMVRNAFYSLKSSEVQNMGPVPPTIYRSKNRYCRTVPFHQVVAEPGCINQYINNNYCMGMCQSMWIPTNETNAMPFISSCSCQPKNYDWIDIELECPLPAVPSDETTNQILADLVEGEPRRIIGYRKRRIQRIIKCACELS